MSSTQVMCPHCNSHLTFGMDVAPGTSVDCLICNHAFQAQPLPSGPAPVTSPANGKAASGTAVPKAANAAASAGIRRPPARRAVAPAAAASTASPWAAIDTGPTHRRRSSGAGLLLGALAACAALLLLVCGGGAVAYYLYANRSDQEEHGPQASTSIPKTPLPVVSPTLPKAGEKQKPAPDDGDQFLVRKKKPRVEEPKLDFTQFPAASGTPFLRNDIYGVDQPKIDEAIKRGVHYLKTHSWEHPQFGIGYSALAGLTLLECGAPPTEPMVARAATYVRSQVHDLDHTYQLALAILFLDRLGEAKDRPVIQGMALRLLAGQTVGGGWSYQCPLLSPPEMAELYKFLDSHRLVLKNPIDVSGPNSNPLDKTARDPDLSKGISGRQPERSKGETTAKFIPPLLLTPSRPSQSAFRPGRLPPHLEGLPGVQPRGKQRRNPQLAPGRDDNSNTQFALLALWAARRHDVPTEEALLLAQQRYLKSQNGDGGWGYQVSHGTTPPMTCVGLIGLAMGHGVNANLAVPEAEIKPNTADPTIQRGLTRLSRFIGEPSRSAGHVGMQNLYFLWSVERTAVLYDLRTIGGKDWYGWGAQILLQNQLGDGAWTGGQYHGSAAHLDTCLALLFLKRSNLVQDLTENLRLYMPIRDPQ